MSVVVRSANKRLFAGRKATIAIAIGAPSPIGGPLRLLPTGGARWLDLLRGPAAPPSESSPAGAGPRPSRAIDELASRLPVPEPPFLLQNPQQSPHGGPRRPVGQRLPDLARRGLPSGIDHVHDLALTPTQLALLVHGAALTIRQVPSEQPNFYISRPAVNLPMPNCWHKPKEHGPGIGAVKRTLPNLAKLGSADEEAMRPRGLSEWRGSCSPAARNREARGASASRCPWSSGGSPFSSRASDDGSRVAASSHPTVVGARWAFWPRRIDGAAGSLW